MFFLKLHAKRFERQTKILRKNGKISLIDKSFTEAKLINGGFPVWRKAKLICEIKRKEVFF